VIVEVHGKNSVLVDVAVPAVELTRDSLYPTVWRNAEQKSVARKWVSDAGLYRC
jgi:hypothetical protein